MSKAPAVDYALRIIEFFSETQKEIGLADICNSLEINKNAASRVLESLLEYNWIYLSDNIQKKYRFTLKPFSVVSKCTPEYALAEIAKNELHRLNEQLGDAVYLGIKNKENVLYLAVNIRLKPLHREKYCLLTESIRMNLMTRRIG